MAFSRLPVFAQRFTALRGDRTQAQFADLLGFSRPTVALYESGDRIPDSAALKVIAEKCNVSADYLIGLTDAKTSDPDIRLIAEYTGLSTQAVETIRDLYGISKIPEFLLDYHTFSEFLELMSADFLEQLSRLKKSVHKLQNSLDDSEKVNRLSEIGADLDRLQIELYKFSELCRRVPRELFSSESLIDKAEKEIDSEMLKQEPNYFLYLTQKHEK